MSDNKKNMTLATFQIDTDLYNKFRSILASEGLIMRTVLTNFIIDYINKKEVK